MAKTKQYRWVCPLCGGGKLAPGHPRRDDVRRYCLPCSEKTGRLVERTCPTLDKKREAAQEQRERRAKAKRAQKARARKRAREAAAVRSQAEKREKARVQELVMALAPFFPEKTILTKPSQIEVHWLRHGVHGHGWAGRDGQVVLYIPRDWETDVVKLVGVYELVFHELAHQSAPPDEHHGRWWRKTYLDAVERFVGFRPADPRRQPGSMRMTRADLDFVVRGALCGWAGLELVGRTLPVEKSSIRIASAEERRTAGVSSDFITIDDVADDVSRDL